MIPNILWVIDRAEMIKMSNIMFVFVDNILNFDRHCAIIFFCVFMIMQEVAQWRLVITDCGNC